MLGLTKVIHTFPSARIRSQSGGLPVEVSLIAQLGHGSGNHLYASVLARQKAHAEFVDELEEPSAKIGGTDFAKGDFTSLYTFVVGPKGHPFHRHAGHRVFTAVSGSGGAQLRFSTASHQDIEKDPANFVRALQYINIPPDCLFTVRFGGETWHQFVPLAGNVFHPAFFALSCHTNELGGNLSESLKQKVITNQADIPSLTELLPGSVMELLRAHSLDQATVPTTTLALDAPPSTFHRLVCNTVRGSAGVVRGTWGRWWPAGGYFSDNGAGHKVSELKATPEGSLLLKQFSGERFHHEDTFCLSIDSAQISRRGASVMLASLLEGFLMNPPVGVSRLMGLRNFLVRPLGLRTSPLGCPVSSLLTPRDGNLFANRYPVLEHATNDANTRSQVVLGANDKHLLFRSCVGVEMINGDQVHFTLGTRVQCKNVFGRLYMGLIDRVHRSYITPTMLRFAVEHAIQANQVNSVEAAGVRPRAAG